MPYRPWEMLTWVLGRCPDVQWSLLGALGVEERSISAWVALRQSGRLHQTYLAEIRDPPSRYTQEGIANVLARRRSFEASGGDFTMVHPHELFARTDEVVRAVQSFIASGGANIILDVSSLPKRFFFPMLKLLLQAATVENLLVTYTAPVGYSSEPLAENFEEWRSLPLFGELGYYAQPELLIVNVGYLAMGLPDQIDQGNPRLAIKLLFPFPNAPASFHRTWQFVRTIERNLRPGSIEVKHTHAMDVSDAFDHLLSLTERGQRRAILAPYGPKPISVAMCIYATLSKSPVYYTQPRVYNPYYSRGVNGRNGTPEIYAYCIRLAGRDHYTF